MDKPLSDGFSIMSAWAAEPDEQSFLRRHVPSLIADLEGADREDVLIDLVTGLIILNGGLLRLQTDRPGVTLANIVRTVRQRTGADES